MIKNRLILVEDNLDDMRTFIANFYDKFEIEQVATFDKYEVLEKIRNAPENVEAVILDLYEKDDNGQEEARGIEVLKEIRRNYPEDVLPVVINSTKSKVHLDDVIQCLHEGAQDWIWKGPEIMTIPEKVVRIRKVIQNAKRKKRLNNSLLAQEGKKRTIWWTYAIFVFIFSLISIVSGILNSDFIGSYVVPVILILSLGVAGRLFRKATMKYESEGRTLEVSVSEENENKD